jgi:hypothetical protein
MLLNMEKLWRALVTETDRPTAWTHTRAYVGAVVLCCVIKI